MDYTGTDEFFVVWSPTGPTPPRVRYPRLEVARAEAERLARQHPGEEFYVLESNTLSVAPPITRRVGKDVPF